MRRKLDHLGLGRTPIASSDESFYDQAVVIWEKYDDPTRALVNQVNVHGYQNDGRRRDMLREITQNKRLLNSVHGEIDGTGLKMAHHLHLDFRYLHPFTWCYWQPFDGKGFGLVMSDLPHKTMLQMNPKYYVLAQYTRRIRPGMTILTMGETETVAGYDPKAHRLMLITENPDEKAVVKTCDLSRFGVPDGPAVY